MRVFFIFISVLVVAGTSYPQGVVDGFFKGKNNADLALSLAFENSSKYFAGTNKIDYNRTLFSLGVFGEYGFTEKWDIIASLPVINGKPQDASMFTKYEAARIKLKTAQLSIIPAVGMSFPASNYNTENGQAIGQRATRIQPKLVVQLALKNGLFFQVQSGYNYALSPVTSSVPVSFKTGFSKGRIYMDAWFDFQQGFGNKDYQGSEPFDSFRELVVSYTKIGCVFYFAINKHWGTFINGSQVLSGRNTPVATTIGTGVVYRIVK